MFILEKLIFSLQKIISFLRIISQDTRLQTVVGIALIKVNTGFSLCMTSEQSILIQKAFIRLPNKFSIYH